MKKHLREWYEGLMQLFFPVACLECGAAIGNPGHYFCLLCLGKWPCTGFEMSEENPVEKIFRGRVPVKQAMAYCFFHKGSGVQQLLHLLKYKHEPAAAVFMGNMMANALKRSPHYTQVDLIAAVPMHPQKEKRRGYNQAALLAGAIAAHWPGKVYGEKLLVKTSQTESQTRKGRLHRWLNMKGRFELAAPEQVRNRHILLVDDVITTGATLESCVHTLYRGNPASVSIASFAWASTVL